MTDRSYSEFRDAEVVPNQGGSNAYLVRFGDGDYEMVNRTPMHELLLNTDLIETAESGDTRRVEDDHVTVSIDLDNDRVHLTVNGRRVSVTQDYREDVLTAYADENFQELRTIHETIVENRVRVGLLDRFMPRFAEAREDGRLRKSDEGWVIDETFVVQWNGENYLTEVVDTHVVSGGEAVRADESREARQLEFDIPDDVTVVDPSGNDVDLSAREAQFLATVEALLNPQEYLTSDEAEAIEAAVENVQDPIASLARTATVSGFTDETDGLWHSHSSNKHRIQDLGVTDEVADLLDHRHDGHSALHEMWARRHEFKNRDDIDVFEDAGNADSSKWQKIKNTRQKAPIPNDIRKKIQETYGGSY